MGAGIRFSVRSPSARPRALRRYLTKLGVAVDKFIVTDVATHMPAPIAGLANAASAADWDGKSAAAQHRRCPCPCPRTPTLLHPHHPFLPTARL